jgi:Fur family ferric uptake transcriptional regulator
MKSGGYEQCLRRCGLKSTPHRTAILDMLERSDRPVAAEQVYLALKDRDIAINLSTVYRTLDTLAGKNLVRRLTFVGEGRAFYEYDRSVHRHYLVCLACRRILSIDRCPLGSYEKALEDETHFSIAGHRLDIYGYCPQCLADGRGS